jgi:hypothetical protein
MKEAPSTLFKHTFEKGLHVSKGVLSKFKLGSFSKIGPWHLCHHLTCHVWAQTHCLTSDKHLGCYSRSGYSGGRGSSFMVLWLFSRLFLFCLKFCFLFSWIDLGILHRLWLGPVKQALLQQVQGLRCLLRVKQRAWLELRHLMMAMCWVVVLTMSNKVVHWLLRPWMSTLRSKFDIWVHRGRLWNGGGTLLICIHAECILGWMFNCCFHRAVFWGAYAWGAGCVTEPTKL